MRPFRPLRLLTLAWALTSASLACGAAPAAAWAEVLQKHVERIDRASPGELGVYVKRLDNGETFSYQAEQRWYLASTAKLPIAIAALQDVESGRLALNKSLVLKDADKVDGSGALVWQRSGGAYTVESLLKRMLMDSDNTAANLLVRTIGEDTLNQRAQAYMGPRAFERLTNFAQVRYDVYAQLHPDARRLTNLQLVQIAAAPMGPQRTTAVARVLSRQPGELQAKSLDEAYERYYEGGLNTATLEGYGTMLERLVRGQLVKAPQHLRLLYKDLKFDTYDAYRLEAGLPRTVRFIHKTGTQHRRACHMGVIEPQEGGRNAIVVTTCAKDLDEHREAAAVFEQLGRAISEVMLAGRPKAATTP